MQFASGRAEPTATGRGCGGAGRGGISSATGAAVGVEERQGHVVRGLGAAAERDRGGAAGRLEGGEPPFVLAGGGQALLVEGRDEGDLALGAVEALQA